jgi:hypothetical protein
MKQIAFFAMFLVVVGCGGEPERSRVVPATNVGKTARPPGDEKAVGKDPRNIATH